jgi:tetratricopeptide (TPR) repeat protein
MIYPSSTRRIGISSSVVALFFTSVTFSAPSFCTPVNTPQNLVQQSAQPQAQDPAQGLVRQAQDLIRTRQFNEAVEILRRAIQTQPNLAAAHIQLSIALMGIGQRDEAFSEAKRAIELDPNDAHAYVALGNIDSSMRRYSEAIRAYKQAASLDPNYLSAYVNLGLAYWTTARYPESAEAFQQALHIDPNNVTALNGLGIAQFHMGQREQGIQSVKQAVKVNPGFVDGHLNLARWYHGMGRYEEAAAAYSQVTKIIPKWPQTYFERSQDNLYLGKYEAAATDARTYLELTDWHSDRAQYMVIVATLSYRGAEKASDAKDMLELAVKRSNSALWPYPIITYLRGELAADALVALAGNNNDRLTEAHGYIGMDQLLKDQKDEAVSHFKWVKEHGNKSFVEYILASIELSRIESGGPIKP